MAKSPARTLLKLLAGVGGALVLLVVGLTLLLQTGAVSSRVKDLVVPRASAALGRQVTVENAKLRVAKVAENVPLAPLVVAASKPATINDEAADTDAAPPTALGRQLTTL